MTLKPHESLLNGKYLIERVLGRGGFGFVYLARDTIIGRAVAIKEMNPALADDDQMVRRFIVEGRAALQVRHPNIVEIYDVFSDRGFYYLAMEYCPGGSLDERLAAGPLAVNNALVIMDQVCAGLAHAHGRGIIHCDIKPANILFGADGQAKVTDFGIAHVSPTAVARSWGTSSGFAGGTLTYMAPEQLDGVRDNPRVDVYALGAMLYRMITGGSYLDFRAEESISDQIHNALLIKQGAPVPPGQRVPGIPAWLDRVVLQALSKQLAARYPDAGALRTALQPSVPPLPVVSAAAQTPKTTVQPPLRRWQAATPPPTALPATRASPVGLWMAVGGIGVLILATVTLAVVLSRGVAVSVDTPTPRPTATWTLTPVLLISTTQATVSATAAVARIPTTTETAASLPTTTGIALETSTLAPTLTPTPTRRPTATPTQSNQLSPILLKPNGDVTIVGDAQQRFVWDWSGPLQPGQGFQVLLWKGSNPPTAADRPVTGITGNSWEQTIRLSQAPAVKQGGDGVYQWTVALIQVDPYKQLAGTPPSRRLTYQARKVVPTPLPIPTR